ncbi:MAG: hypothetical protein HY815_00605 [Candidatus Riflebacteria bacterium]|nr:hypothetical protein [Candidatus Riflebacteria bacterium]
MEETMPSRKRASIQFVFWTAISVLLFAYAFHTYYSGQMVEWYYHTAKSDGYAVDANAFMDATTARPAVLTVGPFAAIEGLQAVPVKKGDRLPRHANGIITTEELSSGKRALKEGTNSIKVVQPWVIKQQKGFKFKDTFKHKGIKTNPWSGAWNVVIVLSLGLSLGLMAQGLTEMIGWNPPKSTHHSFGH